MATRKGTTVRRTKVKGNAPKSVKKPKGAKPPQTVPSRRGNPYPSI